MAWAFGKDLSTSARTVAIEPGGSRRVEERGRLTLSRLLTQRITSKAFTSTTGILADWRTVVVPVLDEVFVTVDNVTRPGNLRLTLRLPVADPIVTHPDAVYVLTQA